MTERENIDIQDRVEQRNITHLIYTLNIINKSEVCGLTFHGAIKVYGAVQTLTLTEGTTFPTMHMKK